MDINTNINEKVAKRIGDLVIENIALKTELELLSAQLEEIKEQEDTK